VKHRRQFFDIPVLRDFHTPVFADPAQVVAFKVHDHRQLSGLFAACDQFLFQR